MVSRKAHRFTLAVEKEFKDFIESKRKKNENQEDCLRRLTGFRKRKAKK